MSIVIERRSDRLWHLWNTDYGGRGKDAADEGFIHRTRDGWALYEGGRQGRVRDVYSSLEEAIQAGRADRHRAAHE